MAVARPVYHDIEDDDGPVIDLVDSPPPSPLHHSKPSSLSSLPPHLLNGFYTDDGVFYSYDDFDKKSEKHTNNNNINNTTNTSNSNSNATPSTTNKNATFSNNHTRTTTTTTTTTTTSTTATTSTKDSPTIINIDTIDRDVQHILQIFPDCDVEYLRSLVLSSTSPNRAQEITDTFLEKRDYKKAKKEEKNGFNLEDAANKDYYKTETMVTMEYADTCAKVLANKFIHLSMTYIRAVMKLYNNHYLPSLRALERDQRIQTSAKKTLKTPRAPIPMSNHRDEQFWIEHEYATHENVLQQEKEDSKLAHQLNEEEYSRTGQLIECGCCFGEYAFDDMAQCPDGHIFCTDCCRKGAEEVLGSGKTVLRCYTGGCNFSFTPSEMAKFLPKKTLDYFQKRQQEEELNQVDIPGLEKCPFCPYAVIIENQDDKIFHCPNCKKDTCRLCKEESHIPLRCNEVEKKQNRDMRLYVETQMTNALCRTCNNPRCKKMFFKEEGCNHMKCTCGWEMCYICRATIKGYDHFKNGKCVLHEDTVKRNQNDVKKSEKQARDEYLEEHPELAVELAEKEKEKAKEKRGKEKPSKKRRVAPITII